MSHTRRSHEQDKQAMPDRQQDPSRRHERQAPAPGRHDDPSSPAQPEHAHEQDTDRRRHGRGGA